MVKTSLNSPHLFRESKRKGDWISKLPNELLSKILSSLTTKELVRTSILSKRWRKVWLNVNVLELDTRDFEDDWDFWNFFDGFMGNNKDLDLTRFKLIYDIGEHFHKDFSPRIKHVIKRRVCHLKVVNLVADDEGLVWMPFSMYSCATLVNLKLYRVAFGAPKSTTLVSLPCVKTMTLKGVKFDGDQILPTLISSCPVLEELVMVTLPDDLLEVICVRSRSLKSFKLKSTRGEDYDEYEYVGDPRLEIDTPTLEYLSIGDYQTNNFIIHNIGPLSTVNIDFVVCVEYDDPSEVNMMNNILTALSTVGEMIISARTLEMIDSYCELEEPVPQFQNLSQLHAYSLDNSWEELQTFLGYCPNVHSLYLNFECLPEPEAIDLSLVPQCFITSLKYVELRSVVKVSDKRLAMHFLRNAAVLKKLTLSKSFENIIKKIKSILKRSRKCEIVIS